MTIFELLTATDVAAYWETMAADRAPYVGEELFPAQQKLGLSLRWIKGSKGLPIVLKPSAFDVQAIPRPRIGFEKLSAEMPFFKESMYIDEELRQELNMVMETGNQRYIDSVLTRVFDDNTTLLEAAAAAREYMRMQALTTGYVAINANGQTMLYDYGVSHTGNATTSWSNATAPIIEDIRKMMDSVEEGTGVRPTRAICNRKTWGYLLNNDQIKNAMFVLTNGVKGALTDAQVKAYLIDQLELEVVVNDKRFVDYTGASRKYVLDDVFTVFPEGSLGSTWFGTTPEESDLMAGASANVSVVDVGVAITAMKHNDPVTVETKVTQICLPSFEAADHVGILSV